MELSTPSLAVVTVRVVTDEAAGDGATPLVITAVKAMRDDGTSNGDANARAGNDSNQSRKG